MSDLRPVTAPLQGRVLRRCPLKDDRLDAGLLAGFWSCALQAHGALGCTLLRITRCLPLEVDASPAALAETRPPRSEALRLFNAILHIIPLLVVESRKEADEVRELVTIAR